MMFIYLEQPEDITLILEDNRFSWAENERQQEIASRNTKITDDIGCIFIRNWQMSGKEGKALFFRRFDTKSTTKLSEKN